MGILSEPVAFVKGLKLPRGFSVCELGNQFLSGKVALPAEPFYRDLGCSRYVSIDGNALGTVTWDLNLPVTPLALGVFDLVTDFGTGEHIFDQAQVWRTLHELTAPSGYIVFDRPTQGYSKHGFYLIDECLLRDVASANRYTVIRLEPQKTPRGWLLRGVFRKPSDAAPFMVPQQGRYQSSLKLPVEVAV